MKRAGQPGASDAGRRRDRLLLAVAGLVVLLAGAEATNAVVAPLRAPGDADWRAAAIDVRRAFRPGDLIVSAPAWADPVMRLHLGDLLSLDQVGRLDAARFERIWEISQRGASAPEVAGAALGTHVRHGPLTVRLWQRQAAPVHHDFRARWRDARVTTVSAAGTRDDCQLLADRHQCPDGGHHFVGPGLLEVEATMRSALSVQTVPGTTLVLEYAGVPPAAELAVGAGVHHPWWLDSPAGTASLRVLVNGSERGRIDAGPRTGWQVVRLQGWGAQEPPAVVRFEITGGAVSVRLAFAAEARGP
jgi:hypothetical protein